MKIGNRGPHEFPPPQPDEPDQPGQEIDLVKEGGGAEISETKGARPTIKNGADRNCPGHGDAKADQPARASEQANPE